MKRQKIKASFIRGGGERGGYYSFVIIININKNITGHWRVFFQAVQHADKKHTIFWRITIIWRKKQSPNGRGQSAEGTSLVHKQSDLTVATFLSCAQNFQMIDICRTTNHGEIIHPKEMLLSIYFFSTYSLPGSPLPPRDRPDMTSVVDSAFRNNYPSTSTRSLGHLQPDACRVLQVFVLFHSTLETYIWVIFSACGKINLRPLKELFFRAALMRASSAQRSYASAIVAEGWVHVFIHFFTFHNAPQTCKSHWWIQTENESRKRLWKQKASQRQDIKKKGEGQKNTCGSKEINKGLRPQTHSRPFCQCFGRGGWG